MLLTIDQDSRDREHIALRSMFAARKRVFIDLLKWDIPALADQYEVDHFDDIHATYLIVTDEAGEHLASARLLPTTRPALLDALFPFLVTGPIPQGPAIFEITRFCLSPGIGARQRRIARDVLLVGLAKHALANDIHTYTGVAEHTWFRQIQTFGWDCHALGEPVLHQGQALVALRIDIDRSTVAKLAAAGIAVKSAAAPPRVPLEEGAMIINPASYGINRRGSPAARDLMSNGFAIIRGAAPTSLLGRINVDLDSRYAATPFCEGGFYGARTKRFGRLLIRSPHMADLVMNRAILELAEIALGNWCERIQLNLAQAIELHPGALAQFPHRDQDMWQGALGEVEYLVNVMWPLTSFTAENGGTIIWPRSHGLEALVEEPREAPIIAEAEPGDAIVFLGSTLHGAGANHSKAVRRGIIVSYCLGWLKPYENQWLAYPPHIARSFPREISELVGYVQHRPNLGNFEGQCPSVLFDADPEDARAAVDALRPDQAAMLAQHVASQQAVASGDEIMSPGATMELVYAELKAKVMRGDFAPGERLEPAQLARVLGVSPTPVRDALYRLSGERLLEAWRHEGFRQPILAEADLHDLYAWGASLLALALEGQPPDPHIPQRSFSDSGAGDYPERVAALFRAIAWTNSNRELRFATVSLIERCHVFRAAEVRVDRRSDAAIIAMDDDFRFGRWSALRSKITRFHRRRILLAGRVVAELRPREESL